MKPSEIIQEIFSRKEAFDEKRYAEVDSAMTPEEAVDDLQALDAKYAANEEKCATNMKIWEESRKVWTAKREALGAYLAHILDRLKSDRIEGKGGAVLKRTWRTVLDTDDKGLIAIYGKEIDSLAKALPPYYTVKVSVDKRKLAQYLKGDSTLQTEHPELVSTRENGTVKIQKDGEGQKE